MRRLALFTCLAALFAVACTDENVSPPPSEEPPDASDGRTPCVTAEDCTFPLACIDGFCQEAPPAEPADASGCKTNADCPPKHACTVSTGECVPLECTDIADCQPGQICDLSVNKCVSVEADGGTTKQCEEGETKSCGAFKLGVCRSGLSTCTNGIFGPCVGSIDPSQEKCDGQDNDCDGQTDEDFDLANDPNNCGTCGNKCSFANATALCVGSKCAMGPCLPGHYDLNGDDKDGCEYACTPSNGGVEKCDLIDNDCDGQIDEGFDQDNDKVSVCQGDCNDADPAIKPGVTEACNGKDDNCDGAVDEGFDQDADTFTTCGTVFTGGLDPARVDCNDQDKNVHPGATEVCNGKDDDCNQQTDEGFGTVSCGIGACANTVDKCQNGNLVTCQPKAAGTETCANAGTDDDCDGDATEVADDGRKTGQTCSTGLKGICASGKWDCSTGTLTCKQDNLAAAQESCGNGADDNCDGRVDENPPCTCTVGTTQPCYDGTDGQGCTYNSTTKTYSCVGACKAGAQTCVTGAGGLPEWGACGGSVIPAAEGCGNPGVDNDCDGNAAELTDGINANAACSTGKQGVCAAGTQQCLGGGVSCVQTTQPGTETCNSKDDDCNGTVDDMPALTCGQGECARTVPACIAGVSQTCTQGTPTAEVCDGKDNNCDGQVDNGLGTKSCGVGECARTVQACLNGVSQTCTPGPVATEICDGKDNNCNGQSDEVNSAGQASLSCGVGGCANTVPACAAGKDNTCTPLPSTTESCNDLDDDCDGTVDNNIPPGSCTVAGKKGVCAAGYFSCTGGFQTCVQTTQATPEDPTHANCADSLDNDCDGATDSADNGCGICVDNDKDGVTNCAGDCDDTDGSIKPGATEFCDGKDNNCNGTYDEGFDKDADTYTTCGTVPGGGLDAKLVDCNDNDSTVNPGKTCDCAANCTISPPSGIATGQGDGKDSNCNGKVDETCGCSTTDPDLDGYSQCQGDCNQADKTIYPGAPELCDGKDNDCNALTVANCDVGQTCNWSVAGTDDCKDRFICARDVTTGKYTCGSFCNFSQAGAGVGDGCRAGESCAASLILSDNDHLCTASGTTGTAVVGAACSKDGDCKSNNCLSLKPTGTWCIDACGNDANYCSANTSCTVRDNPGTTTNPEYEFYAATCYPNALTSLVGTKTTGQTCNPAATNPECKSGDLGCISKVQTPLKPCTADADCGTGGKCDANKKLCLVVPVASVCAQVCCKNADCPSGYFCDPMGIQKIIPTRYIDGGPCTKNSDCEAGVKCSGTTTGSKCMLPIATGVPACTQRTSSGTRVAGNACTSNADCLSQFCEATSKVCVDMCCSDASCPNGTTCEFLQVKKKGTGTIQNMRVCVHTPLQPNTETGSPDIVWMP